MPDPGDIRCDIQCLVTDWIRGLSSGASMSISTHDMGTLVDEIDKLCAEVRDAPTRARNSERVDDNDCLAEMAESALRD